MPNGDIAGTLPVSNVTGVTVFSILQDLSGVLMSFDCGSSRIPCMLFCCPHHCGMNRSGSANVLRGIMEFLFWFRRELPIEKENEDRM
jgi:hypothetical protein